MTKTKYAVRFEKGVIVTRTSNNPDFRFCRCIWETETGQIVSSGFSVDGEGRLLKENRAALEYWIERHPDRQFETAVRQIMPGDKA